MGPDWIVELIVAVVVALPAAITAAQLATRRTTRQAAAVLQDHDVDDRADFATLRTALDDLKTVVMQQENTDSHLSDAILTMADSVRELAATTTAGFRANAETHARLTATVEELNELHRHPPSE